MFLSSSNKFRKRLLFAACAATALFYAVYGYFCAVLYFRESIRYGGAYRSDLPIHLAEGVNGSFYSLMEWALAQVLFMTQHHYKMIGVFLSVLTLATIFLTWILLLELCRPSTPEGAIFLHAAAIACNLVLAIYLPMFNQYRYLGVQSGNIYHNSTYIGMKLFAVASLILYFSIQKDYEKGIRWYKWLLFSLCLTVANLMKPSFFVCFAPVMGICLLADLIRRRGKTFPQIFLFGLAVIPSSVVLLYQYTALFTNQENAGGIIIDFAYSICRRCQTPWLAVIQALAFPLWILIFHLRDCILARRQEKINSVCAKKEHACVFLWGMLLLGFAEYLFLCESGARKNDGNLSWGYCFCIFTAFVQAFSQFYQDLSQKKTRPRWYYVVATLLLLWHLVCGVQYFLILLSGGTYR